MSRLLSLLVPCLLGAVFLSACTTVGPGADIPSLEQRLQMNPNDAEALRDLGVIYMQQEAFDTARPLLARAYAEDPTDAQTAFYHGLSLEIAGERPAALDVYARYREMPRLSEFRGRMGARYKLVAREILRAEMRERLAQEAAFQAPPPNTVAVFPFSYRGDDEQFEPLGRGLSELTAIDLSRVQALTVLERVRLDALLDELSLGQTDAVDPNTAPRVGRILAAGHIFGGSYAVVGGSRLQVDAASLAVSGTPTEEVTSQSNALANFFRLQKDLVFDLIDVLGITLTQAERNEIERIPTENLQAFLAYSRGLLDEDEGRFDAARAQYEAALALDPGFAEAAGQAEGLDVIDETSGSPQEVAVGGALPGIQDLVLQRHRNFGGETGTLPTDDSRNVPGGGGTAGLPRPPRPPGQ